MEKGIGETFEHEGHKLLVSDAQEWEFCCIGCYFFENNKGCYGNGYNCTDDSREDGKNVIFVEVKDGNENNDTTEDMYLSEV